MRVLRWVRAMLGRFGPALATGLLWVGGAGLVLAGGFGVRSWILARPLEKTTAIVIENALSFAPGGGILYTPRLRFRTAAGALVVVETSPGSDEVEFASGELVPVMYREGAPQGAVIATRWRVYKAAILVAVLGTVLFDVGLLMRRRRSG